MEKLLKPGERYEGSLGIRLSDGIIKGEATLLTREDVTFKIMINKFFSIITLALCFVALLPTSAVAQTKIKITKADDLPRRSLQLKGKALEILNDRQQLNQLADQLIKNLQSDLDKYEIEDKSTLIGYYSALAQLYLYKGDYDKTLSYIPLVRELETKQADKLATGIFFEAYINTLRQISDEKSDKFKKAFEKNYAEAYSKLPYREISEKVKLERGASIVTNPELVLGSIETSLQPILDNTKGMVPENIPLSLFAAKFDLDHFFPLKEATLHVFNNLFEANNKSLVKNNIWAERDVDLTKAANLYPVVVAVWDSGVDMTVLPAENRFVNNNEKLNGKDDDNNGYIDDVNGIAYDLIRYQKAAGTLDDPMGKIKSDAKVLQKRVKGLLDLESSINSPEAAEVQQTMTSLKRDQLRDFVEELTFYEGYAHGTHVAGIVAAGNPAAKILAARMSQDYHVLPEVPTIEKSKFEAQMYMETVDYFKKQNVRVVNMSWGGDSKGDEEALAANGVGKNEAERKRMAQEMFGIEKQGLYEAIKNAPDILFVCSAGNDNNDASFAETIPASFDFPNLITVGAVDSEGKRTGFTTEGKTVRLYANGYEVESFVPGGDRLKFSGTSMSSPNVANLAAKLIAVNPKLTPMEVIKLINEAADVSTEDQKVKLINPRKTLELIKN